MMAFSSDDDTDFGTASLRVPRPNVTLRQQVLDVLRRAILDFHFKPGDRLIERELCEMVGVSRTSVREALRHLESEGLVENQPNRGPAVARVAPETALQFYEVREALEGLAARLFTARATVKQVQDLQAALDRLTAAFATQDKRLIIAETTGFYTVLLDGCGNDIIRNMIQSLQARIQFLRATSMSQPGRAPGSLAEMNAIVSAVCRRDPDAAAAAATEHVRRARDAALDMLSRHAEEI
ncbi:GntR family transcriptional regulator [Dongia sp.]|uniref:GntR family transcriptional regulator n=1 Tax=Dongia sp. TaxID=1977262 RepID=UPI0035B251EA